MAPTSVGFNPWLLASFTIMAEVDLAAERVTFRAAWAMSWGLVWIMLACVKRDS
ncbi:hypothetical protein CXB51_007671 [Gossypium anomalum]|uniref:Uncharacterized protein n=1 Tax=Gossypium anomalum TaxID=47600 RepID=A0A8J5YUD7_9ROSI|nr:hypothetical protein CXB51_007671 [Gossypium anomalum]